MALFAFAASLAFRLPTLGLLPPWGDEVLTLNSIAMPSPEMMTERLHAMHSPTYFWMLQLFGLDGSSRFLLRLPSALADSFGAAMISLVAWRFGWRAGIVLGLFYAAMPVMLEEAQDARPYAFFFGFLGLLLWSATRLVDHPRLAAEARRKGGSRRLRWTWIWNAVAVIGLVNMLPLGIFAVIAVDLAILWIARRPPGRALLRPWLIQRLITLLLLAPLAYGFLHNMHRFAGKFWYSDSLNRVLRTLGDADGAGVEYDPDRFLPPPGNTLLLCCFLLLVVLGLILARRRASFAIVVALAFGTQLLLMAVSLHTPLYAVRYFAIATPALTLLAAVGVAELLRRWTAVGLLVGAATFALLVPQSLDAMHQLNKPRFDLAVERLRVAGVERLVVHSRSDWLLTSAKRYLQALPKGRYPSAWDAYFAARNGDVLWLIDHPWKRIHPAWRAVARQSGLSVCRPGIPGITILAVASRAEDLRSSCPSDAALAGAS